MVSSSCGTKSNKYYRIVSLALCFGVAFMLLAGSAMAAGGSTTTVKTTYALQVGRAGLVYSLKPGVAVITRTMSVGRTSGTPFLIEVKLQDGFTFNTAGLPDPGDITISNSGLGTYPYGAFITAPTVYSGGLNTDTFVRYKVVPTADFTAPPVFQINPNLGTPVGWSIYDSTGALSGTSAKTMTVTVSTIDFDSGNYFDQGTSDTQTLLQAKDGLKLGNVTGARIIDLTTLRTKFTTSPLTRDSTGVVSITTVAGYLDNTGAGYAIQPGDSFNITVTGILTGITTIAWGTTQGTATVVSHTVTAAEIAAASATFSVPGSNGLMGLGVVPYGAYIGIEVDGVTALDLRTLSVKVDSLIAANSGNNNTELATSDLTKWTYNGMVLCANYANGNTDAWRSRFYFWNRASTASTLLITVYNSTLDGAPSIKVGGAQLVFSRTIAPLSGLTVKLEDILTQLAVPMPYLGPANNGNVMVEFVIGSTSVTGWTQTFNPAGTVFMGTTPMYVYTP